jgi:hypothetical protein
MHPAGCAASVPYRFRAPRLSALFRGARRPRP